MINKRFVLRNEPFGYTLYDKTRMRHKYLSVEDATQELKFPDTAVDDFEKWSADLSDAPFGILYSPIRIYFELTSACLLRCRTCFNNSGKAKPNELATDDVKRTLEGLRRDNVLDIRFSGGEVTTRPDWFDLLRHAKDLGFSVSLNTNGVYLRPEETIDQLVDLDLEQITISIDGGPKFHDYIRGNGSYEKTVRTLKELKRRGAHLRINTVLTKGSANDLEEILSLAGRFVEEINFFYMRTTGRALRILDQAVSYEELYRFDEKIESFKQKYPHIRILHGSKVMVTNSISPEISSNFGLRIGGPDGFTRLNLLPDGSIWPGGYTPHLRPDFYLGNIKEEEYNLLDVWRHSPQLQEFRRMSLNLQVACSKCPEKGTRCPGGSMEMEFYREKNSDGKNPYCIN